MWGTASGSAPPSSRPRGRGSPCYKLGVKFGREDLVDRFLESGRTGFYLKVLEEGAVAAGDAIEAFGGDPGGPTIAEMVDERRRTERS